MYDTIIVFDRVRENVPRMPRAAFSQIVNRSMSEVLTRSLATSFCTLLPVVALLLFGGDDAEGLRVRAADRRRLRRLLVDLHRLAGAHALEGARARLPRPPRAHRRRTRRRARLRDDRGRRARGRRAGAQAPAHAARQPVAPEPRASSSRATSSRNSCAISTSRVEPNRREPSGGRSQPRRAAAERAPPRRPRRRRSPAEARRARPRRRPRTPRTWCSRTSPSRARKKPQTAQPPAREVALMGMLG